MTEEEEAEEIINRLKGNRHIVGDIGINFDEDFTVEIFVYFDNKKWNIMTKKLIELSEY